MNNVKDRTPGTPVTSVKYKVYRCPWIPRNSKDLLGRWGRCDWFSSVICYSWKDHSGQGFSFGKGGLELKWNYKAAYVYSLGKLDLW